MIKRVVVLGGGVAGIETLRKLELPSSVERVLIDPAKCHSWKPEIHEVAAGTLTEEENSARFDALAKKFNFTYHQDSLASIDRASKTLTLASGNKITYTWLVVAVGSQPNDFGVPGVGEHCLFLNSIEDAERIKNRVTSLLPSVSEKSPLRIAIIGGGATGSQLCAELASSVTKALKISIAERNKRFQMSLIEAGPNILGAFPETIRKEAQQELVKYGVNVMTACSVGKIEEQKILFKDDSTLEADIIIWAAGVKANGITKLFDLERSRTEQIKVNGKLQALADTSIFAAGDCSSVQGQTLFPTAQVARQEGHYLGCVALPAAFENKIAKDFKYRPHGSVVKLSDYNAWGELPNGYTYGGRGIGAELASLLHGALFRREQFELKGVLYTSRDFIMDHIRRFMPKRSSTKE